MKPVGPLVLLTLACVATPARAGGPAVDAYDDIRSHTPMDVHGLVDLYVLHNFNLPTSYTNQLRDFDIRSDQPTLGILRLTLAHHPHPFGFRFDLGAGATANAFYRADPDAATHPDLARGLSYVEQAFVTATIPIGRGIDIDVGKFGTPVGFEDNESIRSWNYSRGLLFVVAEPTLHTGVRASFRATSALSLSAFLVNGWNTNILGGNGMRTFAGAVSLKPRDGVDLTLVYMGGPERAPTNLSDPTLSFRNIVSAYASYSPVSQLSLAVAADYGNDRRGNGASWYGVSGYAKIQPRPWLAVALRTEVLADPQGFMTGTPQTVADATTTLELQRRFGAVRFVTRLEYRHDQSTAFVFEHTLPSTRSRQDTLTLALLGAF